ncbi:transcriptional regulator [Tepidimonas taiwanensis]|uniref:Membrane-associated protein n=1 Tax=Tepidimonas taiwanensis TaxID=307486 RepID=A0A554X4D1_9BURK|nr:hypothetical protein [Tepidimonas taiwanensis]MDM7464275.1 transcriptional regulator [Tepidimonas taiwanensis]TSE30697.1 hypothetical protein Ttaiw_01792 [Tepidimonas taiwanensis]UBQ06005.1 transcriptional regulator [Tepidimonas taiwanensis]
MTAKTFKLVTIYCEAVLESRVIEVFDRLGIVGYTVTECRGRGTHGVRSGNWRMSANVRIEVMCDVDTSDRLNEALMPYDRDYGLLVVRSDVEVLN